MTPAGDAPMNRREAVRTASLLVSAAVATSAGLSGCGRTDTPAKASDDKVVIAGCCSLSGAEEALLVAFADTLLPDTPASPGARAAGCGPIMNMLVSECSDTATRQRVVTGMVALRARANTFDRLPQPDRQQLLTTIEAEAAREGATHWFHSLRDLSHRAFFSSEVGMTKALRYERVPGRWVGCVPLRTGQPAWA